MKDRGQGFLERISQAGNVQKDVATQHELPCLRLSSFLVLRCAVFRLANSNRKSMSQEDKRECITKFMNRSPDNYFRLKS